MSASLILRPYEQDALRDLYAALKIHRRVLFVLPTGGGKTVVAGRYCEQQIRAGLRGLVIVHTVELLEQMAATLARFGLDEEEIGIIWRDDERTNPTAPMQVATIDTLRNRTKPHADFVVVDEADLCLAPKWVTVLDGWYRDAKVLGLTATPLRLDGKPMRLMFDEMVQGPDVTELCALRDDNGRPYLLPPRCFVPVRERLIDTAGVRVKMGDYEHGELERRACATWVLAGVTRWMRELGEDRNGLVFACGIKHVQKLTEEINRDGRFHARALTGHTPTRERREMLRPKGWLDTGKRRVVVTCDVISRGYDLPSAKLVVMARPTCSEALYRHQVGRILRPTTKNEHQPLVLDLTRNVLRFGRPQDPRTRPWSLDAEPVARGLALKQPAARAKQCEVCGTVNPIGATVCEQCATEFPTRLPGEVGGALVEYQPWTEIVCAGLRNGDPCPTQARPTYNVDSPSFVRSRDGRPWRCRPCAGDQNRTLKREPLPCVGPDGQTPCPDHAVLPPPPAGAAISGAWYNARRRGFWRCDLCVCGDPFATLAKSRRQTVCAGYSGVPCGDKRRPRAAAFSPSQIRLRDGDPWRCPRCSTRATRGSDPTAMRLADLAGCDTRVATRAVRGEWVRVDQHPGLEQAASQLGIQLNGPDLIRLDMTDAIARIDAGEQQKQIATEMGLSETKLSGWLHEARENEGIVVFSKQNREAGMRGAQARKHGLSLAAKLSREAGCTVSTAKRHLALRLAGEPAPIDPRGRGAAERIERAAKKLGINLPGAES